MTLARPLLGLFLAAPLGCGDTDASVTGTAGSEEADTGPSTAGESGESGSTGAEACAPFEVLDPGELLPDGGTLEAFRESWEGSYTAGLDWGWAVEGVAPAAYQGITEAALSVEVELAQRLFEDCEEVAVEVESQVVLSTADGAFDEVWDVRWSFEDGEWSTSLSLPAVDGALDYAAIGGEAPVSSLDVDILLPEPGALAALFFTQGREGNTVWANGLAALGGVSSSQACPAFNDFGPGCAPAGCASIDAVPVALDPSEACACLEPEVLCLAELPPSSPPTAYSRETLDLETRIYVTPYELPASAGFATCAPEDDPACGCIDACG